MSNGTDKPAEQSDFRIASQVITDFLADAKSQIDLDADTVTVIADLYSSDKLSKNTLCKALEEKRN